MRWWLATVAVLSACEGAAPPVQVLPVDLGVVEPGLTHHAALPLWNVSSRPARFLRLEPRGRADVFVVTPGQLELAPGERTTWQVAFTSPGAGRFEARFAAVFDTGTAEFSLRALAAGPCAVAETFDVGDARVGGVVARTLTVSNPLLEPGEVFVGAPAAPFFVEPSGVLPLAPGEAREVTVRFSPAEGGLATAPWLLRTSTDCTAAPLRLAGLGLDAPLAFAPGRLDFGTIAAGEARGRTVSIENHSRTAVTVTGLALEGGAFRALTSPPLLIPARGEATVLLEARAEDDAPRDGTLRLSTTSALQPGLALPLRLNHPGPCVVASPPALDLGDLELGCRGPGAPVQLTNTCPHEVRLRTRVLSAGFALTAAAAPSVLPAGASTSLRFAAVPPAEGEWRGHFAQLVDELDGEETVSVRLSARGLAPRFVDELHELPLTPVMLDVLLVLDDSPAMAPLAGSVARNLGDFARYATAGGFAWRAGVLGTSTAPLELGRLRRTAGGAGWLENPTPAELQALGLVRGTTTARSSCLEALEAAFSPPLASEPTELGGLLRPGAALHVICVTNGRDALEAAPQPAITALRSRLPAPSVVSVVAHFVDVPGCDGALEHGPLTALATQANGVREEVCTPNWSAALERHGRTAFGARSSFFLRERPDFVRGPLRAWVDGLELPAVDPASAARIWAYEGATNAVRVEPLYGPAPGATVRFRYSPDCPRP